jgi:tight adherence protein B
VLIPVVVAVVVGVVFFLAHWFVQSKTGGDTKTRHTRNALERIMEESQSKNAYGDAASESILRDEDNLAATFPLLIKLPFGRMIADLALKAGMRRQLHMLLVRFCVITAVVFFLGSKVSFLAGIRVILIAPAIGAFLTIRFLKKKVRKRNHLFLDKFPDVLDMIVRSVRSGFPLNTAIKLVAESMEAPVSTEFQIVADEIAMGRTIDQALGRLAERIDEQDIHFFVVVLNVQQETGGNLAEVINNLAQVIRKRKHLRMKIRAMTSEGRTTGLVLGALPVLLFGALYKVAPKHLEPLLYTTTGNYILATAVGLIVLALWIVNRMVDIDV